ncbi:MAG: protoporphyrinogen oxidase [Candidatus Hydrogenedentota bacterium]
MKPIAVLGGGITGLAAAHYLHKMNLESVVLESSSRPGGVIDTSIEDGFLAEAGPNSLMAATPRVRELVRDAGLENSEFIEAHDAAKKRYIVRNHKLLALPASPGALLTSPVLSLAAKMRVLAEPFMPRGNPDETIADFVRRRIGEEPLAYLVDPFISGIYAGDPERLSMRHAFPGVHGMERDYGSIFMGMIRKVKEPKTRSRGIVSFRSGMKALPEHLAARLGPDFHPSCRVAAVESGAGGWKVHGQSGGGPFVLEASGVICCLPSHALGSCEFRLPGRSNDVAMLAEIPYAPVRTVTLGFRRNDIEHPLDGFGYLIPSSEKLNHLGTLFTSSLFPGRAPDGCVTLASFIGGSRRPDMGRDRLDAVLPILMAELKELLGVKSEPVYLKSFQFDRAIPQMETGHGSFISACAAIEEANPRLLFAGTWRDGISLPNAIESGWTAARRMSEAIHGR